LAKNDMTIQGYSDGVFWERNTLSAQKQKTDELSLVLSTQQ
jgi:hypothetical protein